MNPEKIGKQIVKKLLVEQFTEKVSLYPGAFKPPHRGHVATILRSIDDKTDKVIVFISTKKREDIDVEEAIKTWELYKANIPELEKVEIVPTPFPVTAVYDYAKDNPAHDIRAVFGKGEESRFKSLLDKEKYPHVEVFDAGIEGDFSATNLRQAIRDNDLEKIKTFLPDGVNVEDFLLIFQTNEGLYPRYDYRKVRQVRYKASDVRTNDPDALEEADPKKGTGKKPKGSGRRLYTDENPKDTVGIKFATPADARSTVAKVKRISKPYARKIQILTVGEQRAKVMGKTQVASIFKKGKEAIRKGRKT